VFLNVDSKVIFLALPILPSRVFVPAPTNNSSYIGRVISFYFVFVFVFVLLVVLNIIRVVLFQDGGIQHNIVVCYTQCFCL